MKRMQLEVLNSAIHINSMLEYSRQLAGHLLNLGLSQKAKAIIYLNDSAEFVGALYGINIAGMVFVPVSPQSKDIRLQEIIMHSTAVKQYVNQKYFDRSLQGRGTFERY